MKRSLVVVAARVLFAGGILSLPFLSCRARTPSLAELLANRPTPHIGDLAERSAPGRVGDEAMSAFYDILKLRETGDGSAVPVLEQILVDHEQHSGRIHGYAAAQALFCIGTSQAHAVLSERLLSATYDASHGMKFAFHWPMNEAKRDEFIQRYHLVNLSNDLVLRLEAENYEQASRRWLAFRLTIKNASDVPLRIRNLQTYLGSLLHFRSAEGRFARTFAKPVRMNPAPKPSWVELEPGASHRLRIEVDVKRVDGVRSGYHLLSEDAKLVLDAGDVAYDIVNSGEFSAYAMFESTHPTAAQLKVLGCANPWIGRAVSAPVLVEVPEPPW